MEDDPELRANVNLYKDDDIIAQLEDKISKMNLEEKDSKVKEAIGKGQIKVGENERVVKGAVRKTAIGKAKQH